MITDRLCGVPKIQMANIAVFNLQDQAGDVSLPWDAIERYGITANIAKELWSGDQQDLRNCEAVSVAAHGAKLFRL